MHPEPLCTLVLLRHGQSELTANGCFAGWTDVPLSEAGVQEACDAGRLIVDAGIDFDLVVCSMLERSYRTATIVGSLSNYTGPIYRSWRLNERHYGTLEGHNKRDLSRKYGLEQVREWRRGWHSRPPPVDFNDPRFPGNNPIYTTTVAAVCPPSQVQVETPPMRNELPVGEAPADCFERVKNLFDSLLRPRVAEGQAILVVAHGTSLRCLIKLIENLSDDQISSREIPSGSPLLYRLDPSTHKVVEYRSLVPEAELKRRELAVANQADPNPILHEQPTTSECHM